ncbi:MAG: hypothetical protein ABI599_11750 [Flavobacteriales bacterium]
MRDLYLAEIARLGFRTPVFTRYTILCRWRPPKDHWKLKNGRWRDLSVVVESTGDHLDAAIETCLFLISKNRGTAVAHHVIGPDNELVHVKEHVEQNWSWYDGVVTSGVDFISSPDLVDCWEVLE